MTDLDQQDEPETDKGPLAWDAVRVATVAVLVCVVLAVAGLIFYLVAVAAEDRRDAAEQRRIQECLQGQVAQLQASYLVGREAAKQDRAAQRELLLAQLTDPSRDAVVRFLERLDATDRDRAGTPPPTANCL